VSDFTTGFDPTALGNKKIPTVADASRPRSVSRIDEVSREFESLFLNELFKVMRQTVPKGANAGLATEMFTGMLDSEIANASTRTGGLGIARMIRDQLLDSMGVQRGSLSPTLDGNWVRPVLGDLKSLRPGQRFGAQRAGERPEDCGRGHCGVDLSGKVGSPVRATSDGVVIRVGRDRKSAAGLWLELAHRDGSIRSRYLHMDSVRDGLKKGDQVFTGEVIGEVGNTGTASRGSHLHFEIYEKLPGQKRKYVDPQSLFQLWEVSQKFDDLNTRRFISVSPKESGGSVDGSKERSAEGRRRTPGGFETALIERYKLEKFSGGRQ